MCPTSCRLQLARLAKFATLGISVYVGDGPSVEAGTARSHGLAPRWLHVASQYEARGGI
jgi:hypothetical protein